MADRFQQGLIAAGALIARNIPTSQRLAKLRELIKANAPVDTGALRDSFDDPRTVQLLPDGTIEVDSPLPYARIQDQGGTIPPYDIIAAKGPGHVMRAVIDGEVRFFTKRGEIRIPAKHYVARAIAQWKETPEGEGFDNPEETWIPGRIAPSLEIVAAIEKGRRIAESLRIEKIEEFAI